MGIEEGVGAWVVGEVAGAAAVGTTAGTIAAVAINIAISAALSAAAQAIAGTPDQGANKATRTGNIKQALTPHEWVYGSVRKGGAVFYVNGSGPANGVLHMCVVFAAHEVEEFGDFYINGEICGLDLVKPSDFSSDLTKAVGPFNRYPNLTDDYAMYLPGAKFHKRQYASFQFRTGTVPQVPVPLQVMECANWDASHQANGRAYIYARLAYDPSGQVWPSFIPALTCRVKGRRIYDPRTGATVWSDNSALIAADILENLMGIPRARIDAASLIEAANICDEDVPLKAGGSEKRYRACGYLQIQGEPENWINPIALAMAGAVIEHHGVYYVRAGAWRAPSLTITDADIMGAIKIQTAVGDRDRANACRSTFAGVDSFDQPTDAPVVIDTAAVIEDGGVQEMEINLEWSPSHTQAQRISKIMLLTQRAGRSIQIGTNLLKGLDVMPWDTVNLQLSAFGISGTFRVIETSVAISDGVMAPTLSLQELSADVYAWDKAVDEQDFLVNSALIPGATIEPQNLDFTTATASSAGTFTPTTINATWDDPQNQAFDAIEVEAILHFQYRIGAGTWTDAVVQAKGEAAPGDEAIALVITDDTMAAAAYSFQSEQVESVRIRTRINDLSWSEWVTLDGDLQAPIAGSKTVTTYATKLYHQPASVKMTWSSPSDGTPSGYEVEATMTYDWKQGANPYQTATYTESRKLKGKQINLVLWDKSKPQGSTQFQNHVLNDARVRTVFSDGTVSSWVDL